MHTATESGSTREPVHIPVWLGFCLFLAIAIFFLWEEHRAHILGVLPYALLAACPIVHLFMHRGHHGRGADRAGHEGDAGHSPGRGEAS